jgi:hypothetical protein
VRAARIKKERKSMRRILMTFFAVLMLALVTGAASAQNAHFIKTSAGFSGSSPNLEVTFKEAGLGDNLLVNISASAQASAVYACINGGGNHPQAANKATISGAVQASGTFSVKNGTTSGTLTLVPPGPGSFSCPNGQKLVLASVTYSGVMLTDTTNSVSESISGSFTRTLFTF